MFLVFKEIWNFLKEFEKEKDECIISLHIGEYTFGDISCDTIQAIRTDRAYPQDLLPTLFTEREFFWQPDMAPSYMACCTKLNVLLYFLSERIALFKRNDTALGYLYAAVLHKLKTKLEAMQAKWAKTLGNAQKKRIFLQSRYAFYPYIWFFMEHPCTRKDDREEGIRKLDFMARGLVNTFHTAYQHLVLPGWEVKKNTPSKQTRVEKPVQKKDHKLDDEGDDERDDET